MEEILSLFNDEDIEAKWMKNKIGIENYKIYQQVLQNKNKSQILMESPYSVSLK